MYIIRNILVDITDKRELKQHVAERIKVKAAQISNLEIVRRSIDARKRGRLKFNFTVICDLSGKFKAHPEIKLFQEKKAASLPQKVLSSASPFIIGAGPAGLFAALSLVEAGFKPLIFERGEDIAKRSKKVDRFWNEGILDPESNVQFGLGGAGTFSDGKLTSRGKDFYINAVYDKLVKFGAAEEIKIDALPHLGTDGVKMITNNLRKYLEDQGCQIHFNSKLNDLQIVQGKVTKVKIADVWYQPEIIILAIGNAARDTFLMLNEKIEVISKPFAVGFRIEHPQEFLDMSFYSSKTDFSLVGPATYRLTAKHAKRGVYSFCMCPGGEVIGAATEPGQIVTNGMSYSQREKFYGNSAIVTSVTAEDFGSGALAGMNFQRRLEASCFDTDQPFYAPIQTAQDFMKKSSSTQVLASSYRPMTYNADLNKIFPKPIYSALKAGLAKFDRTAPGFIQSGMLIAPETRTSSPLRLVRDRLTFAAQNIENLFPIGEGSGYAGGIISSAADGYKLGKMFKPQATQQAACSLED